MEVVAFFFMEMKQHETIKQFLYQLNCRNWNTKKRLVIFHNKIDKNENSYHQINEVYYIYNFFLVLFFFFFLYVCVYLINNGIHDLNSMVIKIN